MLKHLFIIHAFSFYLLVLIAFIVIILDGEFVWYWTILKVEFYFLSYDTFQ